MDSRVCDNRRPGPSVPSRALHLDPRAFALVVSGPSGVGKTSICQGLVAQDSSIRRCVTTTTRPKRPAEVDGVDYHFISEEAFREELSRGDFLEWAVVHGFQYGAAVESVETALLDGQVMLLDIDVQGTATWKRTLEEQCVTVFVLPPSLEVLQERLRRRRTEGKSSYRVRMKNARKELAQADSYDYTVVNDDLAQAVATLRAIIGAERSRPRRLYELLSGLGVSGPNGPGPGSPPAGDSV